MSDEVDKPAGSAAEVIFTTALALSAPKRPAYLADACGDHQTLRQRVEALLRAHDAPKGFLPETPGTPAADPFPTNILPASLTEQPGDTIGRYKLLQKIGEGGCGVVYMAEQEAPVRRKVAIKIIKLGMDTKQVVARFEAERQALALMDHANIAKVLDADATNTGRPYFVMELVGGTKITDYCEQNQLTTRQRLDLFIQVCRAIQHAHQKGVIHRDIKPSNVLVATQDGLPVPKVIDFGIAKATQGRLMDQTVFTAFEQFLGTPAYMSPEQAQLGGLDVDTRSDVYSLGVLLYELLTAKTPFDSKELLAAGLDAMRRTICEKEPPTPSARLKQALAAARSPAPADSALRASHSALDKDLDWIVMKCLEKDRSRRYETANGLASDVQRHLNNEPVVAGPPSKLYEFQKTIRRHKFGFAGAAAIIIALLVGALVSTFQAVRATRAERKSAQFGQFMKDMLKGVGPGVALGRDTKLLREILDKTAERVGRELTNQPELEADLRATLGNVYCELADYTNALAMHQRALEIRKGLYGKEHRDVADSLNALAEVLEWEGRLDEAEAMHRDALAMRQRLLGPSNLEVAESLSNLGWTLFFQADHNHARRQAALAQAEPLLREALAIQRKELGNDSLEVARTLNWLALVLPGRNKSAEAEMAANEGLNIYRKFYGDGHPALGNLSDALGIALEHQGKLAEAEAAYRQGMAARQKFLGGEHSELRFSFVHLGYVYLSQGRLPEAEAMFRKMMVMPEQKLVYGDTVEGGRQSLAKVFCAQGRWKEAEPVLREAEERGDAKALNDLAWFLATSPAAKVRGQPEVLLYAEKAAALTGRTNAAYLDTLAAAYAAAGQFTNAVRVQREAIALLRSEEKKKPYVAHLRLFEADEPCPDDGELAARARYLFSQGNLHEAEMVLRECLTLREIQSPDEWLTFNTKSELGSALLGQKKYSDAAPLLLSGYEGMKAREDSIPAASKDCLKQTMQRLIQLYEATDRSAEAAQWKQKLAEFEQAR